MARIVRLHSNRLFALSAIAVFAFTIYSLWTEGTKEGACPVCQSAPICSSAVSSACTIPSPVTAIAAFNDANKEGSDKVIHHSYDIMYGPFLAPFLNSPVRILEIGVEDGRSLKLWQRLFPLHERIVGIGYGVGDEVESTFRRDISDKHTLYTGSQSDPSFLDRVLEDLNNMQFDIIIDDGSHVPWHQIFTLEYLFDSLKDGGLYIIEDIETSYWDAPGAGLYGYTLQDAGIGKRGNAVEKLKGVADTLNRGVLLDPEYHVLHNKMDHLISHITFAQGCVMMWKKIAPLWEKANIQRDQIENYRFAVPEYGNFDETRQHYKSWKTANTWEVAGMQRS